MSQIKVLAAVPLFSSLDEDQLDLLARQMRRKTYGERDVIVRRDTPGDALYILMSGKVKVSFKRGRGRDYYRHASDRRFLRRTLAAGWRGPFRRCCRH